MTSSPICRLTLDSSKGEALLEEPFHNAATTMLIVEDMPPSYTDQLRRDIEQVPGVSGAVWVSSLVGIQIPEEMIPDSHPGHLLLGGLHYDDCPI